MKPIVPSLAAEAVQLVGGDRNRAYAHPKVNFQRIADLWSPILGCPVSPAQVALCMIQVKVSREINLHKRDNLVDLIGYALTLDAVQEDS